MQLNRDITTQSIFLQKHYLIHGYCLACLAKDWSDLQDHAVTPK
jgi:hypothetical protein